MDKKIAPGIRVTVKNKDQGAKKLSGIVVSPQTPRIENGIYWGYLVRHAKAFNQLIYGNSKVNCIIVFKLRINFFNFK